MSPFVNFDALFDADALFRAGEFPWTFFAYPTSLGDSRGLPPDQVAVDLLGEIQSRGIEVAIWPNAIAPDTTYFACRFADRCRVAEVLDELESREVSPQKYFSTASETLFALQRAST